MSIGPNVFISYVGPVSRDVLHELEKSLRRLAKISKDNNYFTPGEPDDDSGPGEDVMVG